MIWELLKLLFVFALCGVVGFIWGRIERDKEKKN